MEYLAGEVQRRLDRQRSRLHHALQGFAFHELHHQSDRIAVAHRVVERHDVGVVEAGLNLNLAFESLDVLGIAAGPGGRSFIASIRRVMTCSILYTAPMPPEPATSITR